MNFLWLHKQCAWSDRALPQLHSLCEELFICRMCVKYDTHIEQAEVTEHHSWKSAIFLKNTFRRLITIGTHITLMCALPPCYRSCIKRDQKSFEFPLKHDIVDSITCFVLLNRTRFSIKSSYCPQRKIRKIIWPSNTNIPISVSTSYMPLLRQESSVIQTTKWSISHVKISIILLKTRNFSKEPL